MPGRECVKGSFSPYRRAWFPSHALSPLCSAECLHDLPLLSPLLSPLSHAIGTHQSREALGSTNTEALSKCLDFPVLVPSPCLAPAALTC